MSVRTAAVPNSETLFTVTFNSITTITTTVTSSSTTVSSWISSILSTLSSSPLIIGLDVEWRPSFSANQQHPVSLLQICSGQNCLLFQLLHSDSIPASLISFLKEPRINFVGVGIKEDVEKLILDYDLEVGNMVDLRDLARERTRRNEMKQMGIKKLALEVMGVEVSKPKRVTLSRWDQEYLRFDQIGYACVDAFLSFEIGRRLYAMGSSNTSV